VITSTKILRSFVDETFDPELCFELVKVANRRSTPNKQRARVADLFKQYGVQYGTLGSGTNRTAFKIGGYAVKIATDMDGKIDNLIEYKMSPRLYPHVIAAYEVAGDGVILVTEYIQPFLSYNEMTKYSSKILKILTEISSIYLIGDVGLSSVNFGNWGIRPGYPDDPVILDFGYIEKVDSNIFKCQNPNCHTPLLLSPTDSFVELVCRSCGSVFQYHMIRSQIANTLKDHDLEDMSKFGYRILKSNEPTTIDSLRSPYLLDMLKKKKKKEVIEDNSERGRILPDRFIVTK
jgi:hypothetical protein